MDTEVAAVSAHARKLFEAQKGAAGLAAARQHFDETLLDWVDVLAAEDEGLTMQGPQLPGAAEATTTADANDNISGPTSNMSRAARARAVSALWIEWAALEKELKQWKQAVKTYDQVLRKCACLTCYTKSMLHILNFNALLYTLLILLHMFNLWPIPEKRRTLPVLVVPCDGQAFLHKTVKPSFKRPRTIIKAHIFARISLKFIGSMCHKQP